MRGSLFLALLFVSQVRAADDAWPQFRGPNGDGHSDAKNVPIEFSEKSNVRWKTAIHDKGWSSPVVVDNLVWLTTAKEDGSALYVMALKLKTGEVVHDLKVFTPKNTPDLRKYNSFASPTPCLEAGRGYFHFGTYGTVCLYLKTAKPIWERTDIAVDHWRGPASSPIVFGKHLFLTFDGHDRQYITALDTETGETVWTKERNIKYKSSDGDSKKAYSTPQVIEVEGRTQLVSSAADATLAYDPKSGNEIWKVYHGGMNEAGRPVFAHGLVYLTAGHTRTLLAVKPGQGDLDEKAIVWQMKKDAPSRPSPLVLKDHLYFSSDEGNVFCLDAKTGEQVWKERLGGPTSASPILVENNLWFFTENGKVDIVAADPKYRNLASNRLDLGGKASPAAVGECVLLRTFTHLYCIAK